jgi:hypothetical protein
MSSDPRVITDGGMNAVGGGSENVDDGRVDVVDAVSAESGFVQASVANATVATMVARNLKPMRTG